MADAWDVFFVCVMVVSRGRAKGFDCTIMVDGESENLVRGSHVAY